MKNNKGMKISPTLGRISKQIPQKFGFSICKITIHMFEKINIQMANGYGMYVKGLRNGYIVLIIQVIIQMWKDFSTQIWYI
ncbi:unnamed protein product [Paramecium primaurelia]|uniref:Uncharacterized protein n=1 Tax=Paramecium primaurelia TaxID=5886 RepID=A0A8S1KX30_PARPR|nr:unnamed protein product [Paramecium primaurelia]